MTSELQNVVGNLLAPPAPAAPRVNRRCAFTFRNVPAEFWPSLRHNRLAWPERPLALVYGPSGTGKTHEVVDRAYRHLRAFGGIGEYITHAGVNTAVQAAIGADNSKASVVYRLQRADVLVVDEFVATPSDVGEKSMSTLREVVFERAANNRVTFLVSNWGPADMLRGARKLDGPWSHRLFDMDRDRGVHIPVDEPLPAHLRGFGEPWHRPPEQRPPWLDGLQSLLSTVTCSIMGEPKRIEDMRDFEIFIAAHESKKLPHDAWKWLQANNMPQIDLLKELASLKF